MRIFLILIGLLLLVPGACGAIFTMMAIGDNNMGGILAISLPSLAVGIGGIFLIRSQMKKDDGSDEGPKA